MAQTFSFPNYGLFNATYYLQQNPDVATSWTGTPLQHYIQFGALEGRLPDPYFNPDFYRASYTDLQGMNALQLFNHYCNYGFNEGRVPMLNFSNFNGARYLLDNPDVAAAGYTAANAISHYVNYGEYEGRAAYADNGVVIQPVVNLGETYTLTTNIDSFLGTSLNDTFNASVGAVGAVVTNTLQNFDSLDGAGGIDKLNVNLQSTAANLVVAPVALSNIEQINVAASGTDALELSLLNAGQAQQVSNVGSSRGLTLSGLAASATALEVQNTAQATTFAYVNTTGAQTSSLNVANVTGAAAITVNGIETVNLTSSGNTAAANSITLNDNALTTLNIAGANALTLATLGATTTTVNGATATGNLTVTLGTGAGQSATLTGGSGNDLLTSGAGNDVITSGAGNDTLVAGAGNDSLTGGDGTDLFDMATNLTTADTIVGGVGVDTLSAAEAQLVGNPGYTNISGIETVATVGDLSGNLTLSQIQAGITGVSLGGKADARTITFDSGVAGTVTMNVAQSAPANGALTVASAGTGLTDSLTITNGSAAANVLNGNALTATGVENLTLNLGTTTATAQTIGAINGITGTTVLTINGNNNVTTGVITAGSVNASGLTGTAAFSNVGNATSGVTSIIGSANADTIVGSATATTILAGAGNDIITGGAGNDSIDGQAGNDQITSGGGNDTLRGGEGDDVFTVAAGNVSVDGGAGNDTVNVGATLNVGDTIDGGAGTNTLRQDTALVAAFAGVTNFQTLQLDAAMTQNMANFTGTTFTDLNLVTSDYTVNNASSSLNNLHVADAVGTTTFVRAVDTATDALTVNSLVDAATVTSALVANQENTLNFNAGATIATHGNVYTLTATQATQINISGVANETISYAANGAAATTVTVNASANTGNVVFTGTNANNTALNITGSATGNNSLTGAAGNDVITGGAAADSLVGGDGKDTINAGLGAVADTIIGGKGADTITLNVDATGDQVVQLTAAIANGPSVALTSLVTSPIAAGSVITFGAGVDLVYNFEAGTSTTTIDQIKTGDLGDGDTVTSLASVIGAGTDGSTAVVNTAFYASGSYNALTGGFTVAANGAGADTVLWLTQAASVLGTNTTGLVLVGVNSANLDAGDFLV